MASFNIHLAVAKLFAKRNSISNLAEFYKGSVDPDLTNNKEFTHYGIDPGPLERNAWIVFGQKVGLSKYLAKHSLDNDYNRGYFLHLIVDLKFFHEFFNEKFLSTLETDIFKANLYYSYSAINAHLIKKYDLDEIGADKILDSSFMAEKVRQSRSKIDKVKQDRNHQPECIIDIARLDAFIRKTANLDLESIAKHARNSSSL